MIHNKPKDSRLSVYWIGGSILLLAAAAMFILILLQRDGPRPGATVPAAAAVISQPATSTNLTATGQVEAVEFASLAFGSPGRVASVPVYVGDQVEAGEVLAKLDATDLEINLAVAQQHLIIQEAILAELDGQSAGACAEWGQFAYRLVRVCRHYGPFRLRQKYPNERDWLLRCSQRGALFSRRDRCQRYG
ncbi:MAG: biotin/lipoyl-binding protein [Chloroflexota bacterium]